MELTYQGLRIQLPVDGAVEVEAFSMDAAFNAHVSVELVLLVEEEKIGPAIHAIADGDSIKVHDDSQKKLLFAGKITDARMQKKQGLCYLTVTALSYTMEWGLSPASRSFQDLDADYGQVIKKVLEDQPGAEIQDCVTRGAVLPDFLLQYEETDWDFLIRLASHFQTFIVPDCCAGHGRAYFGIPELGEETVLSDEHTYKDPSGNHHRAFPLL